VAAAPSDMDLAPHAPRLRDLALPDASAHSQGGPRLLEVENIVVDLDLQEARRDGSPLALTRQEYELLRFFVENRGRVFTRKDLVTQVWGGRSLVSLRTVDIHVYRLRAKLGPPFDMLIATVRRVGYKLCADRKLAESMARSTRTPRLEAVEPGDG
jgi:DNA-binding response OmpR family regulator